MQSAEGGMGARPDADLQDDLLGRNDSRTEASTEASAEGAAMLVWPEPVGEDGREAG